MQDSDPAVRAEVRNQFFQYYRAAQAPTPADELAFLEKATLHSFEVPGSKVSAWSWGSEGTNVLLMHGIYGRAGQFRAFVEPLLSAGFRVTALDAPGHGQSRARSVCGDMVANAICALQDRVGRIDTAIAHSIGSIWLLYAIEHGLKLRRLALLSPIGTGRFAYDSYVKMHGLSPAVASGLAALVEQFEGSNCWERFSPACAARSWDMPGLVVHDEADSLIAIDDGRAVAAAWPGARLVETRGLGHFDVLKDPSVIGTVVGFLREE